MPVTKYTETKYCCLTGMMGAGMNGMAGSPGAGNFMQQVSSSPENTEFTYFSTLYYIQSCSECDFTAGC